MPATVTERQLMTSGAKFGVVWGLEATLSGWTGAGTVTNYPTTQVTSQTISKSAKHWVETDDPATGNLGSLLVAGLMREVSIEVTPSATTKAGAITANIVPEPGDLVTLTDLKSGDMTSGLQFVVKSATGNEATEKVGTISMSLVKYNGQTLTALTS